MTHSGHDTFLSLRLTASSKTAMAFTFILPTAAASMAICSSPAMDSDQAFALSFCRTFIRPIQAITSGVERPMNPIFR
jgi:hypothetical protein